MLRRRPIENVHVIDESNTEFKKITITETPQEGTLLLVKAKGANGEREIYILGPNNSSPSEALFNCVKMLNPPQQLLDCNAGRHSRPKPGTTVRISTGILVEENFKGLQRFALDNGIIKQPRDAQLSSINTQHRAPTQADVKPEEDDELSDEEDSGDVANLLPRKGGDEEKNINNFFGKDMLASVKELHKIIPRKHKGWKELNTLIGALNQTPAAKPKTKEEASENSAILAIEDAALALKKALENTTYRQQAWKWVMRIIGLIGGATFGVFAGAALGKAAGTYFAGPAGAAAGSPIGAVVGGAAGAWGGYKVGKKVSHFFSPAVAKADHSAEVLSAVESKMTPRPVGGRGSSS